MYTPINLKYLLLHIGLHFDGKVNQNNSPFLVNPNFMKK